MTETSYSAVAGFKSLTRYRVVSSSLPVSNLFQLYLVRSVWFQQLVVARTPDDHYVTIPRDCPLAFHLVSKDNSRKYPCENRALQRAGTRDSSLLCFRILLRSHASYARPSGVGTGGSGGSMNRGPRAPGAPSTGATEKFEARLLGESLKLSPPDEGF